ncbi:MAG: YdbH domain-containing protein [Pseudomonadota bacterium]
MLYAFLPFASLPLADDARKCGGAMGSVGADNLEGDEAHSGLGFLARAVLVALVLIAAGAAYLWFSRERIVGDLIDDYLTEAGMEASYDIVSIGPQQQIIANVVVGDPEAPDLTIDRVSVDVQYGLSSTGIGSVTLDRPRLFGSYRGGALTLGALDPVLLGDDATGSSGLPTLDVTIRDGGARLITDYGEVGAFIEGTGPLDDGFTGKLAVLAPKLDVDGCGAGRTTAYGDLTIRDGAPSFKGPIRSRSIACEGAELASLDLGADLTTDADFAKLEGAFDLATGAISFADNAADGARGRASLSLSPDALVLDHDVTIDRLVSPYATLASLRADGAARSGRGFAETSWDAVLTGDGIALAGVSDTALRDAIKASEGTFAAPLLVKLERGLNAATAGASLRGDVTARQNGEALSIVIPEARLESVSGDTVLALSRLSWSRPEGGAEPRLAGNFLTGGADMPQITGRVDQSGNAPLSARLSVAPYIEGANRLAIPSLSVRGLPDGAFALAGSARASGAIPGGLVNALEVPINGRIGPRGDLRLGAACETVQFNALSAYDLSLGARSIRLCPGESGVMVAYGEELGLDLVSEALVLRGDLAGSPFDLSTSGVRFSYPGEFEFADVAATLGEPDNAVRFTSASLTGDFGETIAGEFTGANAQMDVVPLDLSELAGRWSFEDSVLSVTQARFTLTERPQEGLTPRFNPLSSVDASLTLNGSAIRATTALRHQETGVAVTDVRIVHNLSSGEGEARLEVPGLQFGSPLTVPDLTELAKGVIAYTQGTVTGEGRIAWTSDDVTSSGVFRTDDLDLAAAFGPVDGLKGEIRFTDLLNLTTAPNQTVEIGAINPGIEALDGRLRFSLTDGQRIEVGDARWPFMGGQLVMRPTTLIYGGAQGQSYVFDITALDAATFVTQMELSNIGATGTFDGTVGITFDNRGNGTIDQGELVSRAPGGNVSYIGELTYEDMGAISNYAFQSLRSLDYRRMLVGLEGDLDGEIITRFTFDGVRQGSDANQDFITRRLAKLPIRFKINVRSENFYELATMVRTFWDPEALPDAIESGALTPQVFQGRPVSEAERLPDPAPAQRNATNSDALRPRPSGSVQPLESENRP